MNGLNHSNDQDKFLDLAEIPAWNPNKLFYAGNGQVMNVRFFSMRNFCSILAKHLAFFGDSTISSI